MSIDIDDYEKHFVNDYENNDFEVIMTKYRKKKILEVLKKYKTNSMLEIGCGMEPFFLTYDNYEKMVIVEPAKLMFESAERYSKGNNRIFCINDFVENTVNILKRQRFDFILLIGLLNEVENPANLIKSVYELSGVGTKIMISTNNPNSFHLTLAYESGIIDRLNALTDRAKRFQRHNVFSMEEMKEQVKNCGFKIIEEGSYFIKPFSHSQMKAMLENRIITLDVIEGLDKMIKYMPDLGAEIYCVVEK